ncbi:HNH endonuclease signature motif containing protein [Leptospira stimsonii]|uniref:HNH endonuclease n=1 Tax=Leptospira stimsonii TaxID=2202203 RepID=A0ABY2N8Y3_9LEPT|nr:HNH endonuclease signature motif containing protein [Leptospira stimsonii]TGK12848.1 HNH endonuclease [Leptospira stimsonii]TGM18776.1 HNH endonuclease [Leptospira stimsonii]
MNPKQEARAAFSKLSLTEYKTFVSALVEKRGRCDSCGNTAKEVGQKKLHIHHLIHVSRLGLSDPAITDEGNVLVLCNHCHSLFHPLKREYNWFMAGVSRGVKIGKA